MNDAICLTCKNFMPTSRGYGTCILTDKTVYWQDKYCNSFPFEHKDKKEDKPLSKDFLEEYFVKGAEKCNSPEDVLNWYRNLYYKEDENTKRRIVAEAINEFFVYKLPKMLEGWRNESKKDTV